jgi:hypothetical protein
MKVAEGMSERVLMIGPAHTLREAARMMAARKVGAAVLVNPEHSGVGILTERDILNSVAAGEDPDAELAASTAPRIWSTRRGTGPWRRQRSRWSAAGSGTWWWKVTRSSGCSP